MTPSANINTENKKLSVGIVGCGLIGHKRAKVIQADRSVYLCCAADKIVKNAQKLTAEYGGLVYDDWRKMIEREKPDIVIAATPNKYLKPIVIAAAAFGAHILCEKPLGRNADEAAEMVAAAGRHGVLLKTGFNHRFHPAISRAHEIITDGTIGPLFCIRCTYGHGGRPGYEKEWRASRDVGGGGEMLDQGVHAVDLFRWFLGDFDEAFGYLPTCYWDMEVEDNAFALFRTANGQVAQMHTSWTQWKNRFTFEIYGEAGYLNVNGLGGSYGPETLTIGKRPRNMDGNHSRVAYAGGVPEEEILVFDGPDVSWEREWEEFVSAIRDKRQPLGNGGDGLEANRMIAAVYASAQYRKPIKIMDIPVK